MKFVLTFCILFLGLNMNAQTDLAGIWNIGNDNTKIEITEVDGVYEGKIVSSDNSKAKIGKVILKDVQSVSGVWKGQLFAARKGKWMDAMLKGADNELVVTVSKGWRSKTLEWSKE